TETINNFLQQGFSQELVLSLFISRIRIRDKNGETRVVNSPRQPNKYEAFQRVLRQLLDQGFSMEVVTLVNYQGPPLHLEEPPGADQLLSAHKQGLLIQKDKAGHYRLMKVGKSARFCFTKPHEALFERARCGIGLNQRFTT